MTKHLNIYEQAEALRQENRKLALAVSQLTLEKAELERERDALLEAGASIAVRNMQLREGTTANHDTLGANWQAAVAYWDAIAASEDEGANT